MAENLLVRVATTIGSRQGENVASAALVYLLGAYEPVRKAFLTVLREVGHVEVAAELRFLSQRHDREVGGFSDISGVGLDGVEHVIVEAKIAAGLHRGQISRYLGRLGGPAPLLVLLAPRRRISTVFADAVDQARADVVDELRAQRDGVTIVGLSWELVADRIRAEAPGEVAAAEIAQVVGLYEHLESAAFLPFSGDDVAKANGRLYRSIEAAYESAVVRMRETDDATPGFKPGTRTSARSTFGHYGTVAGLSAWFGIWPALWAENADTPFWLQLLRLDPITAKHAELALAALDPSRRWSAGVEGDSVVVAIYPPFGVDVQRVADALTATIASAATLLRNYGVSGTAVAAEVTGPLADDPEMVG